MRSSANLRGVSDQLERSGRKLREMGRRALANKLIMYVMIGLLAAGCFFLLYVQTIGGAASHAFVSKSYRSTRLEGASSMSSSSAASWPPAAYSLLSSTATA